MNPQSFAKFPGHFLAKQTARLLRCCALLVVWLTASPVAQAGTIWDGGGANTNINTADNWDFNALPTSLTDGTQTLTFGTDGSTATINTNVNALGILINRDGNFTIANGAGNLTIGTGGITVNPGSTTARSHLISENNLILAGNQTWAVTNTGISSGNMQLTVSGNISGNFGIIKTGTGGILQLSGSNSFTGGVIVRDGFFNLANTAALGSGTLTLGDNTVTASTTSLTLNFDTTSGTYSNDITFVRNGQSQTKTIQSRVSNATLNGTITLAQDARFAASAGNTLTINGKITGSTGTVVTLLNSQGTVALANASNDFNSGVSSNLFTDRGTLLLRGNDSAGVGGAAGVLGAGTGQLNFGNNNANGDNAQVLIDGAYTIARAINMNQGAASSTSTLGGNTSDTSTFSGNIALASGSNTSFRLTAATNGTVNFTGNMTGTATNGLSKIGNGRVVLSGNNTYTGATTISAGTLQFAKAASLYNGTAASWTTSNITVNSGATLALNVGGTGEFTTANVTSILGLATSINNNGLRGGSQIAFDTTNATGGTFIINDNIVNSSGTGNGTLGLVKLGANTLTLNGTNTYTGNTTVSAGVLSIASTSALPSWSTNGSYSVASGASLAVYNAVTDANITTMLGTTNFAAGSAIGFDTTTADRTYSAALGNTGQGALGLTKVGSNTLTLTANNTYTGNTTISGGTLQVGAGSTSGALGSGAVVNNAALVFNRSDNITVANNISGTGSLAQNASSILTLNGTNTYSGLTNISGNGVIDVGTISNNAIPSGSGILLGSSTSNSGISGILQGNGNLIRSLSGSVTPGSGQISGAAGGFAARGGQLTITFGNNASTELALSTGGYAFGNNFVFGSSTADSKVLLQNNINLNSSAPRTITVNSGVGGDAATSVEFSGVIRNSASTGIAQINKNGDGMLILSNASNSFNGSVSINNGTVSVNRINSVGGGNSVLGSAATAAEGTIALGSTTSTGRLLYTGSGDTTDRVINLQGTTGGGIIDQSGLGTLKFTSNFTATGSGSKTLTLQGSTAGIGEISGAVVNNSAANTTSLTKNGTGTWVLSGVNTYTGATTINAGTLSIATITNGGVAGALGNSTNAAGNLVLGGGTLEYTGSANSTDRNFTLTAGTTSTISVTNSSAALTISGTSATTNGALTKAGSGTLILSGNNSYSGTTTISAGTLLLSSGAAGTPVLSSSSAIINNGTLAFNAPTFNVTYANTINGTGTVTHTMSAANRRVTLSGNNSYSGGTFVSNDAMLAVAADNNLGAASGALTLGNGTTGGVLRIDQTGFTSANRSIVLAGTASGSTANKLAIGVASGTASFGGNISGSGNLDLTGSAYSGAPGGTGTVVFTLGGNNTYTGATSISNNVTVRAGSSTALGNNSAVTLQGTGSTLDLNNNNLTIGSLASSVSSNVTLGNRTLTTGADNTSTSFAGVLAGSGGGLTKTGTGTLTLTGSNTYTGVTTISSGNLSINATTAVGSTSGINLADTTAIIYTGSAAATLDRAISVTGTTGSTGTIRNDGGALTLSGALSKNGTTLTLAGGSNGITVSGAISGSNANSDLIIDGGTTTLTNANNSYNGPTFIINGATLNANTGGALPTTTLSAVTINGSSTLALGANQSVASLSGTSGSTVNLNASTLTINGSATTTYSGGISGTGNLVKNGSGTQTLAGATTFNGTTTVNSGTLKADAANALANTSSIDLNGGSLLVAAANAVNDNANITLRNGGRLAVNGNFDETVGALTLSANSTIDFSGFVGTLRFGSIASWAPGATLSIWNWSGTTRYGDQINNYQTPSNLVFTNNATLTNNLANISFYSDSGITSIGSGFERGFTGGGTEIIAVPEPETYLTGVILLLGGTIYLFRRAKSREGHRPAWPKILARKAFQEKISKINTASG
jgi:autotransporter-associated beta strand protein